MAATVLAWLASASTEAAPPPTLINYQGVLRDAADKPLSGNYDMTLSLWDAASAGNQILVDAHTGAGNVAVSGGLFNTRLGGGTISDGSGPGVYSSIDQVFRDFTAVYLEVKVGSETLAPRTQIVAAAYALNSTNLGGKPVGSFLDTSSTAQTKSGTVTFDATALAGSSGVEGYGSLTGGHFRTTGSGEIFGGHGDTGIDAYGSYAAGIFRNGTQASFDSETYLATDAWGVYAGGSNARGGGGAYIYDQTFSGKVRLGFGNEGLEAYGSAFGGYFSASPGGIGNAYLGRGDYGVQGYGAYPYGMAGYFKDTNYTGEAWLADGNVGVFGYGTYSGGTFRYGTPSSFTDEANLAFQGDGVNARGRSRGGSFVNSLYSGAADLGSGALGVDAIGYPTAGRFTSGSSSGLAYVGWNGVGVYGSGAYDEGGAGGSFVDAHYSGRADLAVGDSGIIAGGNYQGGEFQVNNGSGSYARVAFYNHANSFCCYYSIYGTNTKAFVQNHPNASDKVVVYVSLEGDEAGTYTRGVGRLIDGRAVIELSPSFALVTNPDIGLTAQLTPRAEPIPLAVESVSTSTLVVRGPAGSIARFDYVVNGIRLGTEYQRTVQNKDKDSPLPVTNWKPPAEVSPEDLADTPYERFARALGAENLGVAERQMARTAQLVAQVGQIKSTPRAAVREPIIVDGARPADLGRGTPVPIAATIGRESSAGDTGASAPSAVVSAPEDRRQTFPVLSTAVAIGEPVSAGDLLSVDPLHPESYQRSRLNADPNIVGIVLGESNQSWSGTAPLALAGAIVPCHVDATRSPIDVGDLLVASDLPGYASASQGAAKQGTVVAKALEPLPAGTGTIRVLVMSR